MDRPNFIIILTDDQGYGDLSCMGNTDFKTPHMDRLAASGARFTNWYSNSPVCSPSRASLLTGLYPSKAGVRSILKGHRTATGLPSGAVTLASALKKEGYHTAMFGKWHLGCTEESRPDRHGFDEWFGFLAGCIDYYSHIYYWGGDSERGLTHDLWENGNEISRNGSYFTEMVTERSVDYVREAAGKESPFFMYVAYNAPHYPMHAPQKYLDRFEGLPWDRRIMAAMVSAVDDGVGEILAELERQNILENTCIFFMSDNGPSREVRNWQDGGRDPYYGGSTGGLKGHKFSLFEGGIRVPAIMSWPSVIPSGQVIAQVGVAMDIFPTFLKAAGGDVAQLQPDGSDILPMVAGGQPTPHEAVFWEMEEQTAVRMGKWKLVLNGQLVEGEAVEESVFLSDLELDAGERNNLCDSFPELTGQLKQMAEQWRAGIEEGWNQCGGEG